MNHLTPTTSRPQAVAWVNPVSADLGPYELGQADAANGEYCLPEQYFASVLNIQLYVQGYESVAVTLLSAQARRKWGA